MASSARSWALRIRLSSSSVWEKESRTCFGVMPHTPPCTQRFGLGNPPTGEARRTYNAKPWFATKILGGRLQRIQIARRLAGHEGGYHRLEYLDSVGAAEFRLGRTLRVGHHADNVSARAADPGDVIERAIGIRRRGHFARWQAIPKHDAVVSLQLLQRGGIAEVISFHVADRNSQHLSPGAGVRKGGIRVLHPHLH